VTSGAYCVAGGRAAFATCRSAAPAACQLFVLSKISSENRFTLFGIMLRCRLAMTMTGARHRSLLFLKKKTAGFPGGLVAGQWVAPPIAFWTSAIESLPTRLAMSA